MKRHRPPARTAKAGTAILAAIVSATMDTSGAGTTLVSLGKNTMIPSPGHPKSVRPFGCSGTGICRGRSNVACCPPDLGDVTYPRQSREKHESRGFLCDRSGRRHSSSAAALGSHEPNSAGALRPRESSLKNALQEMKT